MKQVRFGVFETNSSSTHSLTICSAEDFEKWKDGELFMNSSYWSLSENKEKKFVTKEEAIEILTNSKYPPEKPLTELDEDELMEYFSENEIYGYTQYLERDYLETFEEKFTTKNGDKIVAFGKFGYDG